MNREKLIDKLKKLFALGQSANQHEAEAAMKKANDLMTEYQIEMSEIEACEDGIIVEDEITLDHGKRQTWIANIATSCAHLYNAAVFYCSTGKQGLKITFVGSKADVMASQMMFTHLYKSWRGIVLVDMREKGILTGIANYKQSHAIGFAKALYERADALVKQRSKDVACATGRDLVVVKDAALNDYMDGLGLKKGKALTVGAGFHDGYERGEEIPLNALQEDGEQSLLEAA